MLPFPNKLQGELAFVLAAAVFQEAPCTPIIRGAQLKQAESTVDQLCDRPLEGIPTHCDHTIIVFVLTWNPQTQIKMGLPPVTLVRNPLIIEQSRETRTFGKVFVTRYQVEPIVHSMAVIMCNHSSTAGNSQQDIMIQAAETP